MKKIRLIKRPIKLVDWVKFIIRFIIKLIKCSQLFFIMIFIASCQNNPMLAKINGWTLTHAEVNGVVMHLSENAPITLQTENIAGQIRLFGRAPINHYQMTMKIDDHRIVQKSDISTTRMAGEPKNMQLEMQYLQALRSVNFVEFQGKEMIFTSKEPKIVLHFLPTNTQ